MGRSSTSTPAGGGNRQRAARPAVELVADVRETAHRPDAAIRVLPAEPWERYTRDVSGAERPARATASLAGGRWWCHADLGLGYTLAECPDDLVAAWPPAGSTGSPGAPTLGTCWPGRSGGRRAPELRPWKLGPNWARCRRGIQGRQATQAEAPTAEGAQVRGAQHPLPAVAGRRADDRARPCGLRGRPPPLTGARQGAAVAARAAPQGAQPHTLKPDPASGSQGRPTLCRSTPSTPSSTCGSTPSRRPREPPGARISTWARPARPWADRGSHSPGEPVGSVEDRRGSWNRARVMPMSSVSTTDWP